MSAGTGTVAVAALQIGRTTGDKEANIATAIAALRLAAAGGAKILALPELFSTEYFCQVYDPRFFAYAEPIPGPTTDRLATVTRELGVTVVAPIFEIDPDRQVYFNSAAVIGPDGLIGRYRKRHIPNIPNALEKSYFAPGNVGYPVFETPHARIGVVICYDRHFPECYRHLALGGAQIIFTCANTPTPQSKRLWVPEMMVNASGNGVYIVQTNAVGREGSFDFFGLSTIVGPRGELISQLEAPEPGILRADLDLDLIREVRQHYGGIRDVVWSDFGLDGTQSPWPEGAR